MFFYENNLFGDENSYFANLIDNFVFHSHFHRSYELVIVNKGEISISIDNKQYNAGVGDVLLIFPNQIHSFETKDMSQIYLVIFSPEIVGQFSSEYNNVVPCTNILKDFSVTSNEIETDNIYLQKSILYKALGMLSEQTEFEEAHISGDFKLIHRILSFVESHYGETCSLKEVARVLKYDYAYLSKQFIKTMNMGYTEYLNRFRISKACYFIGNENVPISEVYLKCGFENARSFNRNFKKYTHITPSEFKSKKHELSSFAFDNLI